MRFSEKLDLILGKVGWARSDKFKGYHVGFTWKHISKHMVKNREHLHNFVDKSVKGLGVGGGDLSRVFSSWYYMKKQPGMLFLHYAHLHLNKNGHLNVTYVTLSHPTHTLQIYVRTHPLLIIYFTSNIGSFYISSMIEPKRNVRHAHEDFHAMQIHI